MRTPSGTGGVEAGGGNGGGAEEFTVEYPTFTEQVVGDEPAGGEPYGRELSAHDHDAIDTERAHNVAHGDTEHAYDVAHGDTGPDARVVRAHRVRDAAKRPRRRAGRRPRQ